MIDLRNPVPVTTSAIGRMRPLAVELAGPTAVVKTSLPGCLGEQNLGCRMGMRPPKYRQAWSAVALLPAFVALHRSARDAVLIERMRARVHCHRVQGPADPFIEQRGCA